MSIDLAAFRVPAHEAARLRDRPTRIDPVYESKSDYKRRLKRRAKALDRLQQAHYAGGHAALLLILQGMDACGKDGAVRHVMSGVSPQGCEVHSFKPPSPRELKHDFLWRTTVRLPERGRIGIFNRSYYEEVLAVRVHPEMLAGEGVANRGEALWEGRFRSINDHEAHLARNGVKIVKVFLHLSAQEQAQRFLSRIDHPDKTWKLDPADMAERSRWDDYAQAYETCISATSTEAASWHVVPADDKKTARLIVSKLMLHALKALHPSYPEPSARRLEELQGLRSRLEAESEDGG